VYRSRRASIRTFVILSFALIAGGLANSTYASPAGQARPVARITRIALHAAGRGHPYLNLLDGRELATSNAGMETLGRPLSLAAGDFDEDGVPDLVTGFASAAAGTVTLHRGNVDAIYPNSAEAQKRRAEGRFTDALFLSPASVFAIGVTPDFLGVGDFDADTHLDMVAAEVGGEVLYFIPGDGQGGFDAAWTVRLPGKVTSLVVGEMNRRDGLADVIVGVSDPGGAKVLVFASSMGALFAQPETIPLPGEATALALGQWDEHYPMDLAVAVGNEVLIVQGRNTQGHLRKKAGTDVSPPSLKRILLPFTITAMASGDFSNGPEMELALLAGRSTVHLLDPRASILRTTAIKLPVTQSSRLTRQLVTARVSSLPKDDLIVVDANHRQLHVIMMQGEMAAKVDKPVAIRFRRASRDNVADAAASSQAVSHRRIASMDWRLSAHIEPVTLTVEGKPVAVLPMRLNGDALSDLVILRSGRQGLAVSLSAAGTTFTVNNTGNAPDGDTGDNRCDTGNSDVGFTGICTLPAAIQQANATPGADSIAFNVGSGHTVFRPSGQLWATEAITIDGTTQPGFTGSPLIEIDAAGGGFFISGGNSVLRGLVVNRSPAHGIQVDTAGNNIIEGNYLGTDHTGTEARGNGEGFCGLGLLTNNNTVGGTTVNARNLISGGGGVGAGLCTSGDFNSIVGNYFGTDASGESALGNAVGVLISISEVSPDPGDNNTVGSASGRNIISGNTQDGVQISFGAQGNLVQNSYIGTDKDGTDPLGNGVAGVHIGGAGGNTIGSSALRNIISGNDGFGVVIEAEGLPDNTLDGNFIGTNDTGANLGNEGHAVILDNAPASSVSNTVIANNDGTGISALFTSEPSASGAERLAGASLSSVSILDTVIENNVKGISIQFATDVTLENLEMLQNEGLGIRVITKDGQIAIRHTTVEDNGGSGILVIGDTILDDITVDSNDGNGIIAVGHSIALEGGSIRFNKKIGLVALSETNVSILGADIIGNQKWGILVSGGTRVDIAVTDVNRNFKGGALIATPAIGIINSSVFENAGTGVVAFTDAMSMTGASIRANGRNGMTLIRATTVIEASEICENDKYGILAIMSPLELTNVDVEDCGNGKGGIRSIGGRTS
jgi:hypothetical protein